MKSLIEQMYKTKVGGILLSPLKWCYDFYRFRLLSDQQAIRRSYKKWYGRYPDLDNPKLFTEKLQWLKLNDRTPLHTQCADKYGVREYIKKTIGEEYLIPLVYDTDNPNDIRQENLPDYPVVIKQNHDSGYAMTFVHDKTTVDFRAVQSKLKKGATINYFWGNREWQYKNIKPRIIVEKLLIGDKDGLPDDIKVHCFNGKVEFVELMSERFTTTGTKEHCLDANFEKTDFTFSKPLSLKTYEKPFCWELIKQLAEKLASPFAYARVDFYEVNRKVYFGEITFHPDAGIYIENLEPKEMDEKLGKLLKLPIDE